MSPSGDKGYLRSSEAGTTSGSRTGSLESRFPAALTDAVATRIRSSCRLAFA
jgi:hypothetical protein